ncbi:hypothetical protein JW707_02710 [Candidatus Woesearchaeota archaeon]|nr:hypothetical protein [Candidatus Woesearchaeota archaeon]
MSIVSELESNRVKDGLDSVPVLDVKIGNILDPYEARGRIAEKYVHMWLSQCPGVAFDSDLPREVNGFTLRQRDSGVLVVDSRNGSAKHEYDFLVGYDGTPFIVHVKSWRLNGFEQGIEHSLAMGREIYGVDDITMLLFFPQYGKANDAERIHANHPNVICVDTGYKKKHLAKTVTRFYKERGMKPPVPLV